MAEHPHISIDVQVFANLRDLTGFKRRIYDVPPGLTVKQLLTRISYTLPRPADFLEAVIDPEGDILRKYVKVIIDGKILFTAEALKTVIDSDGCVVAIFPPIGGG